MSRTEISHFWVGQVPEHFVSRYFQENYNDDHDNAPVSAFARDQGVHWYDHDFLEYGWGTASTIEELVAGYSYSDQWKTELANRVAVAGLTGINFFMFLSQNQLDEPRSVTTNEFWLRYMGVIGYSV